MHDLGLQTEDSNCMLTGWKLDTASTEDLVLCGSNWYFSIVLLPWKTFSHTAWHAHICMIVCTCVCTEKAMAPHSSTLVWEILWLEKPGRLQSMGLLRVGHNWANSLSLFIFMHWRRKWQPTPVFLPGESQGWGSLLGCCLWGRTESDTTEVT